MMNLLNEKPEVIEKVLYKQLNNYWDDIDKDVIRQAIPSTLDIMKKNFYGMPNKRFFNTHEKTSILSPYMSIHWMIFLYRLAHQIYINGCNITPKEADQIYYLNKIMHSNDWFYAIDLPLHFMCEHPLGSVLGRAKYGDYLFIYQGTTVGGNRSNGILSYPQIGNNVVLYANATVLGNTTIGNNVMIAAGTQIINEVIPDNCIVFGKSPNLIIKKKSEEEIKQYTQHIWGWENVR